MTVTSHIQQFYPPARPSQAGNTDAARRSLFAENKPAVADTFEVRFGAIGGRDSFDEDTDHFWDLTKRKNKPKDLVDRIVNGRYKVSPDGKISFPVDRIKEHNYNYKPNPNPLDPNGKPSPGDGGLGSGPGGVGKEVGKEGDGEGEGEGGKKAGDKEGENGQEMWSPPYPPSEVAKWIGENFQLPFLENKGKGTMTQPKVSYNNISRNPPGLILYRKTLPPAIAREYALAEIEGREPDIENVFVMDSDIKRVSWKVTDKPLSQAVIFYVMDVSGSVSEEDKELARTNNFLLSTWLKYQYGVQAARDVGTEYTDEDFFGKGVAEEHIIFTTAGKSVSREEFYTTRQSGGTMISSGLEVVKKKIDEKYNPRDWNIYVFLYSDGGNWGEDNHKVKEYLDELLQKYDLKLFGYGNLEGSSWHDPTMMDFFEENYDGHERIRSAVLDSPDLETYRRVIKDWLSPPSKGGTRK